MGIAETTTALSIAEQVAHNTVRIESEYPDGSVGTGTGFFYRLNDDGNGFGWPVIVTNRHVVNGATKGRFRIAMSDNPEADIPNGRHKDFVLESFSDLWTAHPDDSVDLCVMPISQLLIDARNGGEELFFMNWTKSEIPTRADMADMIGFEGVTMIGYPNGLWDEVNNQPIVRRGGMASNIKHDWNGKKEFLIDVACFPGSSGSPVLLLDSGQYLSRTGLRLGFRIKLLGILYAGPLQTIQGDIVIEPVPTTSIAAISVARIPINLGIVIKSERLLDFEGMFC